MPNFQPMFMKSKGKPITYNDKQLFMVDTYQVKRGDVLQIIRESTNSEWRQGIALDIDGEFELKGKRFPKKIILWEDTAPRMCEIVALTKKAFGSIHVRNAWDIGDGIVHSWHGGAAMIPTQIARGRRYECNDAHPDEDFDDIIFRIETIDNTDTD